MGGLTSAAPGVGSANHWWGNGAAQKASNDKSSRLNALTSSTKWKLLYSIIFGTFLAIVVIFLHTHRGFSHGRLTSHVQTLIERQMLSSNLSEKTFFHTYYLFDAETEEDVKVLWYRSWKSLHRPASLIEVFLASVISQNHTYIQHAIQGFTQAAEILFGFTLGPKSVKKLKQKSELDTEQSLDRLSHSFASVKHIRQRFRGSYEKLEQEKIDRRKATETFVAITGFGDLQLLQQDSVPARTKREICMETGVLLFMHDVMSAYDDNYKQVFEDKSDDLLLNSLFYSWTNLQCAEEATSEKITQNGLTSLDFILHSVVSRCSELDEHNTCGKHLEEVFAKVVENNYGALMRQLSGCDAGMLLLISTKYSHSVTQELLQLIEKALSFEGLVCRVGGIDIVFPVFQKQLHRKMSSRMTVPTSFSQIMRHSEKVADEATRFYQRAGTPPFLKVKTKGNIALAPCQWCEWYLYFTNHPSNTPLLDLLNEQSFFNGTIHLPTEGRHPMEESNGKSIFAVPNLSSHLHSYAFSTAKLSAETPSGRKDTLTRSIGEMNQHYPDIIGIPPREYINDLVHFKSQYSNIVNLKECMELKTQYFLCDDNSRVHCSQVNDGICDCPQAGGVDEPSTGACARVGVTKEKTLSSAGAKYYPGQTFWCRGGIAQQKLSKAVASMQDILNLPQQSRMLCIPSKIKSKQHTYRKADSLNRFLIPSSKVNDGICDCIDGEDELDIHPLVSMQAE